MSTGAQRESLLSILLNVRYRYFGGSFIGDYFYVLVPLTAVMALAMLSILSTCPGARQFILLLRRERVFTLRCLSWAVTLLLEEDIFVRMMSGTNLILAFTLGWFAAMPGVLSSYVPIRQGAEFMVSTLFFGYSALFLYTSEHNRMLWVWQLLSTVCFFCGLEALGRARNSSRIRAAAYWPIRFIKRNLSLIFGCLALLYAFIFAVPTGWKEMRESAALETLSTKIQEVHETEIVLSFVVAGIFATVPFYFMAPPGLLITVALVLFNIAQVVAASIFVVSMPTSWILATFATLALLVCAIRLIIAIGIYLEQEVVQSPTQSSAWVGNIIGVCRAIAWIPVLAMVFHLITVQSVVLTWVLLFADIYGACSPLAVSCIVGYELIAVWLRQHHVRLSLGTGRLKQLMMSRRIPFTDPPTKVDHVGAVAISIHMMWLWGVGDPKVTIGQTGIMISLATFTMTAGLQGLKALPDSTVKTIFEDLIIPFLLVLHEFILLPTWQCIVYFWKHVVVKTASCWRSLVGLNLAVVGSLTVGGALLLKSTWHNVELLSTAFLGSILVLGGLELIGRDWGISSIERVLTGNVSKAFNDIGAFVKWLYHTIFVRVASKIFELTCAPLMKWLKQHIRLAVGVVFLSTSVMLSITLDPDGASIVSAGVIFLGGVELIARDPLIDEDTLFRHALSGWWFYVLKPLLIDLAQFLSRWWRILPGLLFLYTSYLFISACVHSLLGADTIGFSEIREEIVRLYAAWTSFVNSLMILGTLTSPSLERRAYRLHSGLDFGVLSKVFKIFRSTISFITSGVFDIFGALYRVIVIPVVSGLKRSARIIWRNPVVALFMSTLITVLLYAVYIGSVPSPMSFIYGCLGTAADVLFLGVRGGFMVGEQAWKYADQVHGVLGNVDILPTEAIQSTTFAWALFSMNISIMLAGRMGNFQVRVKAIAVPIVMMYVAMFLARNLTAMILFLCFVYIIVSSAFSAAESRRRQNALFATEARQREGHNRRSLRAHSTPNVPIAAAPEKQFGDECVICMDEFTKGVKLRVLHCGHRFHPDCIADWLVQESRCPVCRDPQSNFTSIMESVF